MGRRISSTDDPRKTSFLFQRLSVAVQRFNAVSFTYSFGLTQFEAAQLPRHTEAHHRVYTICLISPPFGTEYQGQIINNNNNNKSGNHANDAKVCYYEPVCWTIFETRCSQLGQFIEKPGNRSRTPLWLSYRHGGKRRFSHVTRSSLGRLVQLFMKVCQRSSSRKQVEFRSFYSCVRHSFHGLQLGRFQTRTINDERGPEVGSWTSDKQVSMNLILE